MEQRLCTERVTSGDARRLFASMSLEKQWLHLALNSPHLFLPGRTSAQIGPTAAQSVGLWFQDQPLPWRLFTPPGYILSIFFLCQRGGGKIRQFTAIDLLTSNT